MKIKEKYMAKNMRGGKKKKKKNNRGKRKQ